MINLNQDNIIRNIGPNEGITLPFAAPVAWWTNQRSQNPNDGVDYFGGWACNAGEYRDAVQQYGQFPYWKQVESGIGTLMQTRSFLVAPFASRWRWMDESKGDSRTGGHLQQIVYAGYTNQDGGITPWGPIVLSLKVTAQMRFNELMKTWSQKTYAARLEYANGLPAHYFWMPIGSFGNEPVIETVGKGTRTSAVVLPQLFEYEKYTEKVLTGLCVDQAVADQMAEFRSEANEWLNDKKWKQGEDTVDDAAHDAAHAAALAEVMPAPGVSSQMFTPEPFPF